MVVSPDSVLEYVDQMRIRFGIIILFEFGKSLGAPFCPTGMLALDNVCIAFVGFVARRALMRSVSIIAVSIFPCWADVVNVFDECGPFVMVLLNDLGKCF